MTGRRQSGESRRIRVLIVDDHTVIREGLALMLRSEPDIELVGDAVNGAEAVDKAVDLEPDVILMDLHLPVMDGAAAMAAIRARLPETKFVVLSAYGGDEEVLRALEAGAHAYLLKDGSRDSLFSAVRSVFRGQGMLDPQVTGAVLGRINGEDRGAGAGGSLTPREREVLVRLTRGAANKEIAADLGISPNTVKTRLARIYNKLGVNSRTEAVAEALRRGLIRLE